MSVIARVLSWVLGSRPVQWMLAALAAVLALRLRDRHQKRKGRAEAREEHRQSDIERAMDIHRRAADAERLPVEPDDTRGYRD